MNHMKHLRLNRKTLTKCLALLLSVVVIFGGFSFLFFGLDTRVLAEEVDETSQYSDETDTVEPLADGDANGATNNRKLLNGSFEEGQTWTDTYYKQPSQSLVPAWNTTSTDGKIELFRQNTGTYIKNVKLIPTDGTYAAELNAEQESTLYQNVKTTPSSIYEWGLDHGARNGTDIMALVIGPKQSVDPAKPAKNGRDQLMQMVDWLNIDTESIVAGAKPEEYIVYSKKFASKGTFEDNAGNNAFSMTPSTIYTEEWKIWIMASSYLNQVDKTLVWNSFGSNQEGSAGSGNESGSTDIDFDKYYLYTVPTGQTETLFGFVSVGFVGTTSTSADKIKTYGNFLDNINFQIYHDLSGSSTNHGSAIVGGSDGTSAGEGASSGHEVTVNNKLATYVPDGQPLKIQAIIKKADLDDGCEFAGISYTRLDEDGNVVTVFLQKSDDNVIQDTGNLTDEEKQGKWIKSVKENGDVIYTYYLDNITSSTDLHFIFYKSPTITYDPNGGKPYIVERTYNTEEAENVYSFKPESNNGIDPTFIPPYVSKAAEGQNDGWKFMGWKLIGDVVDNIPDGTELVNPGELGSLLLPAVHTVACDYDADQASYNTASQYFKIYNENVSLTESDNITNVVWEEADEETRNKIIYANIHRGLTMVAQWRWLQAFIPQVGQDDEYHDSDEGGTVEITNVVDKTDENYNDAYTEIGGKSYHAATDETISVTAIPKEGYKFVGWYDPDGNLVSTKPEYGYIERKESVNIYYARFSNNITQTYIRQVKNGDEWVDIEGTDYSDIANLGRYTYTDAAGKPISSTATAGTGYRFVGWYDSEGNKVPDDMLINNGATISYITTVDATYYARFEDAYTLIVSKIDGDKSTESNKVPLAGAEFALYKIDSGGDKTIVYENENVKCTLIGNPKVTALNSGKTKATAVFGDLLIAGSEYLVVETKAAAGYRLLDAPMKITIDDTGNTALIDGISKEISNKEVNIELANYLTVQMPTTGEMFTGGWFTVVGLVLLFAAAIGLFSIKISRIRGKN